MKRLSLIILFLLMVSFVMADMGPKPTMDVMVTKDSQIINTPFKGAILSCQNQEPQNLDEHPDPDFDAKLKSTYEFDGKCYWAYNRLSRGGDCTDSKCTFHYMLPKEFKLAVYLPSQDSLFISNKVDRVNFHSRYEADIKGSELLIKDTTPFFKTPKISSFLVALFTTLIIETIVGIIMFLIMEIKLKNMVYIILMNIISVPILWFIFGLIPSFWVMIILGEVFVFAFEAYFIKILIKTDMKRAIIISIALNLASFVISGFFLIAYMMIFGF